jgi:homopolymeric O-antigen transport system ATP-binding protein
MSTSISVQGVSKRYQLGHMKHETMLREAVVRMFTNPFRRGRRDDREFWALKDVSFEAGLGEVIGLIGANGAGKSTLLKILSKIIYPTIGCVQMNGRVASLLEVGTGFHEELTGRQNIYLNGSILGMKKQEIDAKLDEIVDFSGVERFIDTPLKRYSSGMALRLGFAVAAHLETEILLVDEVLAVGDIEFQRKCLKKMESLHDSGRTVIFVSHNLNAVEGLCSRVIWVADGQVKADGPTKEIVSSYMAAFAEHVAGTPSALSQITERDGDGKVRFTGLEILDQERKPKALVQSGDTVVLRLHYHSVEPITRPCFGVRLYSGLGARMAEVNSWTSGVEIRELPMGQGSIEVEFDALNFMPGRYSVSLWVAGLKNYHDVIEYCAALEVGTSDFYGSGRGTERVFGPFLLPCTWQLNGNSQGRSRACTSDEPAGVLPNRENTRRWRRQQ